MIQTVFKISSNKITGITTKKEEKTKPVFAKKVCAYPGCNNEFTPRIGHQLYCSDECRHYSDMDHTAERVRRYRKKFGEFEKRVGTGGLGSHRDVDFSEEERKVRQEMRVLGLSYH